MPDSSLEIPLTREEWVKMEYPEEDPIVVGVIARMGRQWVCFHRTEPSQYSATFDSPGGVDVGLIRYLERVGATVFLLYPRGSGRIYLAEVTKLHDGMVTKKYRHMVMTRDGKYRDRVFLPRLLWETKKVKEPYVDPRPASLIDETRLNTEGVVLWRRKA